MVIFLLACGQASPPSPVRVVTHRGDDYHVVTVDLRTQRLELVGQGPTSTVRTFADVARWAGPDLVAATNSGIFHRPDEPVGLFVAGGVTHHELESGAGQGNFYLEPNGVFVVGADGPRVVDTARYAPRLDDRLATQSGPALLLDGAVHPAFRPASTNQLVRSAVGVSDRHTVHLVLSKGPGRLHDLATLFRDLLRCTDALYLDGVISGLLAENAPAPPRQAYAGFLVVRQGAAASRDVTGSRSSTDPE